MIGAIEQGRFHYMASLPDRLQQTHEIEGDEVVFRFATGLTIVAELFHKSDPQRILPLGRPQGSLMNHIASFPDVVRGVHVFEPFAGSGAFGFAALRAGAAHVTFLDVNPRAATFHARNAALNGIDGERYASITGDVATHGPDRPADLVLANPPFVPTPEGIEGTLTSNGGPDGNRFVRVLLERLERVLAPGGRALVYVFQLVSDGRPLLVDLLDRCVPDRHVELTPAQERLVPFEVYAGAYRQVFAEAGHEIERWRTTLTDRHGAGLGLCHYVARIGPRTAGGGGWAIRDDFAETFGASFLIPSDDPEKLALGRILENVIPPPAAS